MRPSAHSVLNRSDGIKRSRHHKWVKHFFRDKIVWDFDPARFIEAVWNFRFSDIPTPPLRGRAKTSSSSYRLHKDHIEAFMREKTERGSYRSLVNMGNSLLEQLFGPQSSPTARRRPRKLPARFRIRDKAFQEGYTKDMVDLGFSTVTNKIKPRWDFEAAYMEVKKTRYYPYWTGDGPRPIVFDSALQTGKRKRHEERSDDEPSPKRACTPISEEPHEGEQQDDDDGNWVAQTGPAVASPDHGRDLTNNEAQLVRYMNNLMSANVRSFGIGWLIEDDAMRLCYGDRMGIVLTEKFRFIDGDRELFLLTVAAMGSASPHGMGIFPDLHFQQNDDGESFLHKYAGAQLRVTARQPDREELENFEFNVQVGARRVYTEFGTVGRGTSVIPIVATPDTATYKAFGKEKLVAKVSWPHARRRAEDSLIIAVRRGLKDRKPAYLRHVVDLKCSVTRNIEDMGLPRHAMGLDLEEEDVRVSRTLILKSYRRLEEVGSVEGFKQIYIHVVRAHHWVWVTSHILHRDISTNNIMWFFDGKEIIGVLCDWDLAEERIDGRVPSTRAMERIAEGGSSAPPRWEGTKSGRSARSAPAEGSQEIKSTDPLKKPRYRTGTGPFMALDLLRDGPPPFHLYRHDLESLFYLLAYACAVYDPENNKFGHLVAWEHETLSAILTSKRIFLQSGEQYDKLFENAHPSFKPLSTRTPTSKRGWLARLAYHFNRIERIGQTVTFMCGEGDFGPTAEDDMIVNLRDSREQEITYEKFMDILGAPYDV
ncbi:hypothetical protein EVJ58_g8616 [Rhodofomes roseus]|uniref:Fungal-type protein kinase domain-containing protein n=1 Tax=Rhodofomes roseus TaxID=34475 RepID=A0A4Y9XYU1_9APHY|nr:hypothetical protein EVJ58_g8616 [Rhodofomes roseus]